MSISIRTLTKDKYVHQTLGLKHPEGVEVKGSPDNKALRLSKPQIIQHSGKDDVEPTPKLGQGRIYELSFGTIHSQKDQVLVSVNPVLGRTCVVTQPGIVGAKQEQPLSIFVYTVKQVDISELDWILSLSVLS
jgi:hypothetical protein